MCVLSDKDVLFVNTDLSTAVIVKLKSNYYLMLFIVFI